MDRRCLPHLLIVLGLAMGALTAAELAAMGSSRVAVDLISAATSAPFVAILVGGGYWLSQGHLPADRLRRVAGWAAAGLLFVGGFFLFIALNVTGDALAAVGIFRWGVAAGAGGGLLVGLFEARAIQRAVATERAQVRATELQRQNERLEEFASIIAHDIRSPLSVATGHLELAREGGGSERLDTVADALGRVEAILSETLTLARSGQVIGATEAVDLRAMSERCWRHVETAAATLELDDPPTITADPDRIEHLLENLFRNAVEHGGAEVAVRVGGLPGGFFVEDDGPGIPEDERASALEAGVSTAGGTGFGLAIVSQIAEAHGWRLAVTASDAGGARFEFGGIEPAEGRAAPA